MNDAHASSSTTMVTAVFPDSGAAEQASDVVAQRGYAIEDVNVVMSDETRQRYLAEGGTESRLADKSEEGGALGGPTGGRVSLAISIAAAVGAAIVIPGLGLAMAGPLAVALAGAGAAGVAATAIGLLSDWGVPDERVQHYDRAIREGAILIGVKARSPEDAQAIAERWRALGGQHVHC
jgi:hypothetical protein